MEDKQISRLQRIEQLKNQLFDTNAMVIKVMEGHAVDDTDIFAKRQLWREQIATLESMTDDDYMEYTEPEEVVYVKEVPSANDIIDQLKELVSTQVQELSDEDALKVAALYPTWVSKLNQDTQREGKPIALYERLWDDGKLWKCITPHNALKNWKPKDAPSLFVEVSDDEWPEIPEVIPAENPWMSGQKGTWKGEHYISAIDNNVWNPDQYPAGWEKQE